MSLRLIELRQKITATIVVIVMILMIFSNLQFYRVFADANTVMNQTVSTGGLSVSAPPSLAFNGAITIGAATNSLGNLVVVNAIDYSGSGAGWTVSMNASDFFAHGVAAAGGYNTFVSSTAWVDPGTLGNYNAASETGIAVGSPADLLGATVLFNASTNNGMGAYFLGNSQLNIIYNGSTGQKAGTYTATSTLTIA